MGKFLWVLDNGHGKGTPGKRSPKLDNGTQFLEYEFNRDIVKRLITLLKDHGIAHHNLVPELESDISLKDRVSRANNLQSELMKIYVSVHANAADNSGTWHPASGIETYCFRTATKSERLAKAFQKHLVNKTGWKNRGVKTANFYVIRHTRMPAVLTENGFYQNKEECTKLMSNEFRQKIAVAHFDAIKEIEQVGLNF